MKNTPWIALLFAIAMPAFAQQIPGAPETNGLAPKTATIYINRQTTNAAAINNNNTESLGVAIANGGNVLVGWEDDGNDGEDPLKDLEAVWTMLDASGAFITPSVKQSAVQIPGTSITNNFLSFFRADGSGIPGATAWGPKIHANLFGDGVGMGATATALGPEISDFAAYSDTGDFPAVQLLSDSGQPAHVLAGVSAAYAARDGDIRIADWEFLSNGNILIVGESRQDQDLIDLYMGSDAAHHAIFRIVDASGNVVKAETLVSAEPVKSEIWHGAGVTKNGFAVRFSGPSGALVRLFDNSGNPTSTNIDLGLVTGHAEAAGGGRGDGAGFHGNGQDAYVVVTGAGADAWVTVLSATGDVRFSRAVADDLALVSVGASDATIDPTGNVIVVFDAKYDLNNASIIMGRRFDATGKAVGRTFYVSEKELPTSATAASEGPRIAWRDGQAAVVWVSQNDLATTKGVVGLRLFSTASGLTINQVTASSGNLNISWSNGTGPYTVQKKDKVTDSAWVDALTTPNTTVSVPISGALGLFRVVGH